jgi:hypothetical protein
MEFIIHESGGDGVPPGTYQGVFDSFDCELETSKGKAIRWAFKADDGRTIDGISDRESKPTTKNKTGRWLAAISGKPLTVGTAVDPTQYIGKRYLLIVSDGGGGKGKLDTFSRLE